MHAGSMKKSNRGASRRADQSVDVAELNADWLRAVNDRQSNFWTRQRMNWESRYCVWSNQSSDGRRWPRNAKHKVWPWPGASDARVHLVDKYVREDVALLMAVWTQQKIMVHPHVPARDAGWARRMTALLRWLVYEEMEESEDEAEYLANLFLERGAAAMGVWWDYQESYTRQPVSMEQLIQAGQQARQRLAHGEQSDALAFQASLPLLVADPAREADAVQALLAIAGESPLLNETKIKGLLEELRTTGETAFPKMMVAVNRPCIRALAWNEDIWTPPEATAQIQQGRRVFVRELLSQEDSLARARQYEWDAGYVDEVIDKQKGRTSALPETLATRGRYSKSIGRWNSALLPDDSELYEWVSAYERLADEDGVQQIQVTVFNPAMCGGRRNKKGAEPSASSTALDYAHGQYPFKEFVTERRTRMIEDARGYGEVASTWQAQIKRQWDMRTDRSDVATLPPSHHPPGEEPDAWGPGVQVPTMQPEHFGYFDIPKLDNGSQEIETTVRQFADEYFGREVKDQNPTLARALRAELVRKWMKGWKGVHTQTLQLCQQYMPDNFYFRVVGGEGGRGIRATREEIQGPFSVTLKFNADDLDRELVQEKLELMKLALEMDVNGIVDRNEAISAAFELVDPSYAERLLQPAESAALKEVKDEQDTLAKLLLGIPVDVMGNEAFGLRKKVLTQTIQASPVAQQLIQGNEAVRKNVERRIKQLDFNIQQKLVNPEIGRRLGTKPAGMGV